VAIDLTSPTWRDIAAWATTHLSECQSDLESPIVSHDTSQVLRGRIAQLKALLALPTQAKRDMIPSDPYV
jgi:hypothetical protein